jgi:outer membrane lipoprotein-sorting protein
MLKQIVYFISLLVFIPVLSFSQTAKKEQTTYQAVDPKAKTILDQVSAKTKAYKTIEAEFAIIVENKQEKTNDSKKGKIYIKGNKYKADLATSTIFNDGKTQWTYMKDPNEVNITSPDPNDDNLLNPAKMFTIYEKGYKIRFINERFEKARALYEIELYPIDLKKDFSKITLMIDKQKMQLFSMKRFGKDGTNYYIEVLKMDTDNEMADGMFTFDKTKYPKVEINDMRE